MRIGITGLPGSGCTTLFQLLGHVAPAAPRHAGGPAVASVKVPDPRLDRLAAVLHPKKVTPATVEFLDVGAVTKGAGKGEGLGAQVLSPLRQVDAILLVVRTFVDPRVPHVEGKADPARDSYLVSTELLLADLAVVEKRIERIEDGLRKGRKEGTEQELELLRRCRDWLGAERPLRELSLGRDDQRLLRGFALLSARPLVVVVNLGEDQLGQTEAVAQRVQSAAQVPRAAVAPLCAKVEWEIAQLSAPDAAEFKAAMGLEELVAPSLIRICADLLGLLTFYTAEGGEELRAWTMPRGSTALQAAGTIHSDMERGFIKAEVIASQDLQAAGSLAAARKKGLLRLEGKDYVVADGDLITIRFNI